MTSFETKGNICWCCYGAQVCEGGVACPLCCRDGLEFSEYRRPRSSRWVFFGIMAASLAVIVGVLAALP